MLSMISITIMAFICVFVVPGYSYRPYKTPRDTLLTASVFLLMMYWVLFDGMVFIDRNILALVLVFFGWALLCSLLSPHQTMALRGWLRNIAAACLGLVLVRAVDQDWGIVLFVIAALINSVYAIVQNKFRWEPFKKLPAMKPFSARGLIGNSNMLGAYLVPHVFMGIYLSTYQSPVWLTGVAAMVYAIWLTKCRAAFLSLACGSALYACLFLDISMIVFTLGVTVAILYLLRKDFTRFAIFSRDTLRQRVNIWRVALEQIKKTPVFGLGYDGFQAKVPYLQKHINTQTNGAFLDPDNYHDPWPRYAHSDYLQTAVDVGLPGLWLLAGIVAVALFSGFGSMNAPFVGLNSVILIGILVNGLVFHATQVTAVNIIFWYVIGNLLSAGHYHWTFSCPVSFAVITFLILGFLIYRYIGRWLAYDICMDRYLRSKMTDDLWLDQALKLNPSGSKNNTLATYHYIKKHEFHEAYIHASRALAGYDGEVWLWDLWSNIGSVFYYSGSLGFSIWAYETALTFLPYNNTNCQVLTRLNKEQGKINEIVKRHNTPGNPEKDPE